MQLGCSQATVGSAAGFEPLEIADSKMQLDCSQATVGSAAGFEPLEIAGPKAQTLRSKRQIVGLKALDRSAGYELIGPKVDLHAEV